MGASPIRVQYFMAAMPTWVWHIMAAMPTWVQYYMAATPTWVQYDMVVVRCKCYLHVGCLAGCWLWLLGCYKL